LYGFGQKPPRRRGQASFWARQAQACRLRLDLDDAFAYDVCLARRFSTRWRWSLEAMRSTAAWTLSGGTPLDVILSVMSNPALPLQLRFDAAVKAAPFCHPKLAPIEHGGKATPAPQCAGDRAR
jgi:hypothetical protein